MKYKKTGIIIQARTGSQRLANKVILPFYKDKPIIEILVEKLKAGKFNIPFVIATTESARDNKLAEFLEKKLINVFRGSENDVLKRFIDAAKLNNFQTIIRVCADNPFFDFKGTIELIDVHKNGLHNYTSYCLQDEVPIIKSHLGLWGEVVELSALEKVDIKTSEKKYHEHVTNFIYENKKLFDVKFVETDKKYFNRKDIRLTVDTKEDFEMCKEIYSNLANSNEDISPDRLIKFIDKKSEYLNRMEQQIKKNLK